MRSWKFASLRIRCWAIEQAATMGTMVDMGSTSKEAIISLC